MLNSTRLAAAPEYTVDAVACRDDHRGWSAEAPQQDHRIVLVRRGRFRRRADGVSACVDRSLAYLGSPGQEESFAHPCGGDLCTAIHLSPKLWRSLAGEPERPVSGSLHVDGRLDLAHRRLYRALDAGDPAFAVTEELLRLVGEIAGRIPHGGTPSTARQRRDRAVLGMACEALGAGHPAAGDLLSLANLLAVSPFRLSRIFTGQLGVSLTRYRNGLRVAKALELIEAGAENLGAVAVELGFADQAHLSRTVRQHCGHSPAGLRRLLGAGTGGKLIDKNP